MKMAIMQAAVTARLRMRKSAECAGEIADKADSKLFWSYSATAREPTMSEPASLIMLQFLTWVADRPRTREQAVEAWHSCPHISVWEDAIVDGLVRTENDGRRTIALTKRGAAILDGAKAVMPS
jgi:hypothetical protein